MGEEGQRGVQTRATEGEAFPKGRRRLIVLPQQGRDEDQGLSVPKRREGVRGD